MALAGCALVPVPFAGDGQARADAAAPGQAEARDAGRAPGVEDRLERLEQDVAALRIALSRLDPTPVGDTGDNIPVTDADEAADLGSAPPAEVVSAGAPGDAMVKTMVRAPVKAPAKPAPAVGRPARELFAVHLASYRDADKARRGWRAIARDHPSLIGVLTPVVARVELGGNGTFYRLKAGPFETWDGANDVCDALKDLSWTCAVLDFEGVALDGESAPSAGTS